MGALRGAKRDAWEGGHRVPFLARWPGKIPAGSVSDETICHVDLMATVAADARRDAARQTRARTASTSSPPSAARPRHARPLREATVHHSRHGKFAIRKGDWVLIDAPSGDDNNARGSPQWFSKERGYTPHTQPGELFNLRQDRAQRRNLYAERPEIVRELKALLERYKRDGRSTPGAPQKNERTRPVQYYLGK